MEKFFIKDSSNTVPSKILNRGKSFNFSEWQYGTTYENNEYKQDFVTYDGQLWGCLETNINTPPSLDCKEWSLLLTANSIYKFYWKLFGDNEAKLLLFNRIAKLPEKFVPGEIYYIDELQTVVIGISETEYIEYNASPEIRKQLDENVPFENGSIKNSAILKGGYNQVSNEHEVAIGKYNKSDSEDIIYSVGIGTSDVRKNAHEILQNGEHYILGIGGYDGTNTNDANDLTKEINRIISNTNKIDDLKDAIIDNEKVIAKAFSDHQSKISQNSSDIKQVPFEKGTGNNSAVLKGTSNSATNNFATAFGEQTTASADRAFSEGLKTKASGANSHAEGLSTLAQGQNSHAEGNKCEAIGNHSHAEGNGTIANGGASHAEGSGTITKNNFEHAEGRYNVSNKDDFDEWGGNHTIHSIGIGTSTKERKNAHEILQNGKHYIYGIGGYNGTNVLDLDGETATAYDLATVVNDKVSKNELDALSNDINERISDEIASLVDSAPETLNTLNELADAIQENESVIDTLNSAITNKVNKEEGKGLSTNDYTDEDKERVSYGGAVISDEESLWSAATEGSKYGPIVNFTDPENDTATLNGVYNIVDFSIEPRPYVEFVAIVKDDWTGDIYLMNIYYDMAYGNYSIKRKKVNSILTAEQFATQAEIDAIFDGNSGGTSSSY